MSQKIRIDSDILFSLAYHSLRTAPTVRVFTLCLMKTQMQNGKHFKFEYKEALDVYRINDKPFALALKDLVCKGFLDVVRQGSGPPFRKSTIFALSDRWKLYGTPDFVESKPAFKVESEVLDAATACVDEAPF